jgi:hypothetical protein
MMEFNTSTRVALGIMDKILHGTDGWRPPQYLGFDWFHKVDPGRILHVGIFHPTSENGLKKPVSISKREVLFYIGGDVVAIVTLEGIGHPDTNPKVKWDVCGIRYASSWSRRSHATGWFEMRVMTDFQKAYPSLTGVDMFARMR